VGDEYCCHRSLSRSHHRQIFARNLEHRLAGEALEFEIDWTKGY
jgi:hypothetical protein